MRTPLGISRFFPSTRGYAVLAVPIDEVNFQRMLKRASEFHGHVEALDLDRGRIYANIRARMHWHPNPPALPPGHRKLVDQIVELLEDPQLSSSQAHELERAFVLGE